MGIIIRQSIKSSIVNFTSAAIGAINILIIYERLLSPEELGKIKYITSTAFLFLPIVTLGISTIMLRFFPKFKNENNGNNGILGLGVAYLMLGFLLYLLVTLLVFDYLPEKLKGYYIIITILLLVVAFLSLFSSYLSSLKNITVAAIFNNLLVKIGVPALVLLYAFDSISFENLEWNLITVYGLAAIGLLTYIYKIGAFKLKPNFKIFTPELKAEIKAYAIYSILGPVGAVLVTQLDQFMVTELLDFKFGGIYTIAVYFGSLFAIPMNSVFSIANPVISDSFESKDEKNIRQIYSKSSINLLFVGILLLLLIWSSIDEVFALMSKGNIYSQGKYVILLLAVTKIVDMSTSVNGAIIAHSKYFRFNLYSLLFLGLTNIILNFYLIKEFGIEGAALATLISLTLYNIGKGWYVWYRFRMQPFTKHTIYLLIISTGIYGLTLLLSFSDFHPLISIGLKSTIITVLFVSLIYTFKVSEDINHLIDTTFKKIFK